MLLLLSLAATGYFVFLRSGAPIVPPITQKTAVQPPLPPLEHERPNVAIVIDDMGYRKSEGDVLLNMKLNLSFSFLPFGPHSPSQAQKAQQMGRDILLHLPLEPFDPSWNLGPGGLYVSMNKDELRNAFARDLAVIPMAIGVNNHMGSRFTENQQAMKALLEIISEKQLFFLDSLTSPRSTGYALAKSMGIKTSRRDIFLDNEPEKDKVADQFRNLMTKAEKYGWAIGLAHPNSATLETLQDLQPQLTTRVNLVGISELMN